MVAAAILALAVASSTCGSMPANPESVDVCSGYPEWQTSPYVVPYPVGTSYRVAQGNCSGGGHSGVYKYSYDFDMPIGTLVTAARDGVVFEVRTGYVDGDLMPAHVSTCSEPVDCGTLPVTFRNVGPNPTGLMVDHVYLAGPY